MQKRINWCKQNIFSVLTALLLAFIPLYPKLPTIDIYGTWVSIRLEDFLVVLSALILFIRYVRRRMFPNTYLTGPILTYWAVGAISLFWSIVFIGPHLANYFPHLAVLHYIRRIEYMIVFFIAYEAMKERNKLPVFIWVLTGTMIGIILYGLGQKLYGFPAYLTMNEEFAKGIPLRLPPTARIPSTFGGHYDLGAYLVLMIPVFASLVVGMKKIWQKLFFLLLAVSSLGLLLLTASRVSFGVYLVAISVMFLWHKKPVLIIPAVIISFIMLNFVSTASERFYKTFRFSDVIVDLSTGRPIGTLDKIEGGKAIAENQENPAVENLPKGTEFINVPQASPSAQSLKNVQIFRKSPLSTGSGEIATISGSFLIQKAFVYDISITTRFQGQWPKAIEAFKRNIILGSGYSTLSVASDGDYLRMMGETGILGTLSFLGIFAAIFALFLKNIKRDTLPGTFIIGVAAGLAGLFLNAILIDVFEASKVAFTVWLLLGICIGLLNQNDADMEPYPVLLWRICTHPAAWMVYLVAMCIFVYRAVLGGYFVGDDFTWLRWAATSSAGDIGKYFTDAGGFFYRPLPKLWYFILYSVFWLKAGSYHMVTMLLYSIMVLVQYLIARKIGIRRWIAWICALLFGVLSVHHENLFWISGASSLLAGLFASVSVLVILSISRSGAPWYLILSLIASIFLSMFSYEGSFLLPLVLYLVSIFEGKRKPIAYAWILLAIPLYWYVRRTSGAFTGEGDYSYNMAKIFINVPVNTLGYIISVFFGPRIIEVWGQFRNSMKSQIYPVMGSIGFITALSVYIAVKFRTSMRQYIPEMRWILYGILFLVPYIGLGGIAERYTLVASVCFLIALALLFEKISVSGRMIMVVFVSMLIVWNSAETRRISGDWGVAHTVSKQSLLTMRTEFFPVKIPTWFIFVDIPLRYGRAWIYPTGMGDAVWHLFRGSQYTYLTEKTLSDAFAHNVKGAMYVLTFEDNTLKRVQMETKYE